MMVVAGPSGSGKLDVFDDLELYDNATRGAAPRFLGSVVERRLVAVVESLPDWVPEPLR